MTDSNKLALLWNELRLMKDKLDNEIIPVGGYLEINDPKLMTAMQELSGRIGNHFEKFKLVAEGSKNIELNKTA